MRNPYKVARERFSPYWMFMGTRRKLFAMRLVAGEMFWAAVSGWSRRLQKKVCESKRRGTG